MHQERSGKAKRSVGSTQTKQAVVKAAAASKEQSAPKIGELGRPIQARVTYERTPN